MGGCNPNRGELTIAAQSGGLMLSDACANGVMFLFPGESVGRLAGLAVWIAKRDSGMLLMEFMT